MNSSATGGKSGLTSSGREILRVTIFFFKFLNNKFSFVKIEMQEIKEKTWKTNK